LLYALSILLFVAKSMIQFTCNKQVYKINTRQNSNLHKPVTTQIGVYFQGIKIDTHLPKAIKHLSSNNNTLKLALKNLLDNSFYSLKECFDA
jgi:hypothetical protein